jgi:formylglycine-generating enzyme required for sulfatase activity
MPVDSGQPTTAGIRRFLTEFFSDEELSTLCFDYFRDVYDDFASGMTKGQKIQLLIERCERRGVLPNLLAAIQRARPDQYKERFPQVEIQPEPPRLERDPRQVFLSNAHQDSDFAHRLAADLRKNGWRVWIAPDSIQPGEKWGEAIDRGLGESRVFIVALTPAAIQSRWVRDETYVAIELEKKGQVHFVPLDVKPCDAPNLWNVYQRITFSGNYAEGLKELLTALEQAVQFPTDNLATVPKPSQGLSLSAYVERLGNPLLLLLAGVGVVGLVVLVIVTMSIGKGPATPTPVAAIQPTWNATNILPSPSTQPANTPMPPTPTTPPTRTPVPATPAMTPTAMPGIGPTRVSEKDGMVMVYVPAGEFLMGSADSDSQAYSNEKPQHTVYLDAFWIDKTEVTNAQYKKCVQAGACKALEYARSSDYNGDTQPVVEVDWFNAQAYCQWAGRQLPTEAQWEKAARGTDGRIYPWGNQAATCEYAVMNVGSGNGCGKGTTWPVGSKPKGASPYGALDMAGNVWEWVADWYSESYYAGSPSKNPPGPASGEYRVPRGGSFYDEARVVRGVYRGREVPGYWAPGRGFRCVCASGSSSGC